MTDAADSPVSAEELKTWRAHIGRSETRRQTLDAESLRRFAAAVGADLEVERQPPPLGHWAWFLETVAGERIGADGHPLRGGLLPPVRLPRRMFAAASIEIVEPVALGREGELSLTVADVDHRAGKTGGLVRVTLDRVLTQDGRARVIERQTLVYRGAGGQTAAVEPAPVALAAEDEIWTPGPVDLFRFSAAAFNAHRIHYDLPYATEVEGYPALVVQGPLTAARLCAFTARSAGAPLRRFAFRAVAPLFADQAVRLTPGADAGEVQAVRCDGTIAMTARGEV